MEAKQSHGNYAASKQLTLLGTDDPDSWVRLCVHICVFGRILAQLRDITKKKK